MLYVRHRHDHRRPRAGAAPASASERLGLRTASSACCASLVGVEAGFVEPAAAGGGRGRGALLC